MQVENYLSEIILILSHFLAIGKLCLYVDNLCITFHRKPHTLLSPPSSFIYTCYTYYTELHMADPHDRPYDTTHRLYSITQHYIDDTALHRKDTAGYTHYNALTQYYIVLHSRPEKIYPACTHALRMRSMFSRVSRFPSFRVSGSMFSRVPEKNL